MTEKQQAHTWLKWAAGGMTLVLASLLCWHCADIYRIGNSAANLTAEGVRIHDMYTRQIVGERLMAVAPWAVLWAVLLVLAGVTGRKETSRLIPPTEDMLALLLPRVDTTPEMLAERRRRKTVMAGLAAVMAGCAVWMGVYLLDRQNFTDWDLEWVMGEMLLHTWVPAVVGLAAMVALAVLTGRSIARELALARKAPRRAAPVQEKAAARLPLLPIRVALYAGAVILVVAGILNGGLYDVLVKAINICTECIGLG